MNNNIKFSVTVPAYKVQFLKECIDSILAQTYQNFELIIVNDASPQDLDSIVTKYYDSRIHYYKNKIGFGAKNVVGNWNKCLEYATGDYIICMGDDDKLLPNCLMDYYHLIQKYPNLNVYHMRTLIIDENSNLVDIQDASPEWESAYSLLWHQWRNRETWIGDYLFRANALRNDRGYVNLPYAWHSDRMTSFLLANTEGVASTYYPGFCYRISSFQISSDTFSIKDKLSVWYLVKKQYLLFLSKEPKTFLDQCYWKLLNKNINSKMKSYIMNDIGCDLSNHYNHIFHWLRMRKKYGLDIKDIVKIIVKRILVPKIYRKSIL
jgi:glycosyltransferase involved in cell wall biosynthesis